MNELLKNCYQEYRLNLHKYIKAYDYYKGNTDALRNYISTDRANNKVSINYVKKFIKEEIAYSLGNDVNYISRKGDETVITDIYTAFASLTTAHDSNLMKKMLIFGEAFEIYYLDRNKNFNSKVVSPLHGYAYTDANNDVVFFMHIFTEKFEKEEKIDIYMSDRIIHLNSKFTELKPPTPHYFGRVPVGVSVLSEEGLLDTVFSDIKGMQDALETIISDATNEISDFRNCYMLVKGAEFEDEEAKKMKSKGMIEIPNDKGSVDWLIKRLDSQYLQFVADLLEDKMYQISFHINNNEKMQSNLSGIALRSRLLSLEEKTKLNQHALTDCIKQRLQVLFTYLQKKEGKKFDYRDIKIKFTCSVPQDDLTVAQIVSQVDESVISNATKRSLFSFVDNPAAEEARVAKEQASKSVYEEDNTHV